MDKSDQYDALASYYEAVNIVDKQLSKQEITQNQHQTKIKDLLTLRVEIDVVDRRDFKNKIYQILSM